MILSRHSMCTVCLYLHTHIFLPSPLNTCKVYAKKLCSRTTLNKDSAWYNNYYNYYKMIKWHNYIIRLNHIPSDHDTKFFLYLVNVFLTGQKLLWINITNDSWKVRVLIWKAGQIKAIPWFKRTEMVQWSCSVIWSLKWCIRSSFNNYVCMTL